MENILAAARKTASLAPREREEILEVCNAAFGAPFNELFDLVGPEGTHVLGRLQDGRLASHVVITRRSFTINGRAKLRAAYFDATATRPDLQGQGCATAVLRAALEYADARFDMAGLSTHIPPFYARLGFAAWQGPLGLEKDGAVTMTDAIEGVVMVKTLAGAPPCSLKERLVADWRPGGGW